MRHLLLSMLFVLCVFCGMAQAQMAPIQGVDTPNPVTVSGTVTATLPNPVTVSANDLDIRPLAQTDTVTAILTAGILHIGGVAIDAALPAGEAHLGQVTVNAVDLDIHDLSSARDSVSAAQSGTWNVTVTSTEGLGAAVGLATDAAVVTDVNATLIALIRGLVAKSVPATPTSHAATSTDILILSPAAGQYVVGWSLADTTWTTTGTAIIRAGTGPTATTITTVNWGAHDSVREPYGFGGVDCAGGLYLQMIVGTVQPTFYYKSK